MGLYTKPRGSNLNHVSLLKVRFNLVGGEIFANLAKVEDGFHKVGVVGEGVDDLDREFATICEIQTYPNMSQS